MWGHIDHFICMEVTFTRNSKKKQTSEVFWEINLKRKKYLKSVYSVILGLYPKSFDTYFVTILYFRSVDQHILDPLYIVKAT